MGIPNIQQQMYLKKALNENMDGMFDHTEQLDESYTMRMQYGRSAKVTPEQRAAAKAKGDAHVAKMSKTHTWVKGSGKNGGKWVPKQETNESTYAKAERASRRTGAKNFGKFLAAMDRRTANEMRRGGASRRTMKAYFNQGDFAAGSRAIKKFETDARRKQMAISPITEGLLHKIELAEGSIRASKIGKGKKFSPKMYDKYKTKTAVRQLIKTGRDPNSIKFPLTRGLENYGFNVNAEDKRKAALKAKGLLREPKPLDPYTRAEARRIGDKVRNRKGLR